MSVDITVKTQKEWDELPKHFDSYTRIIIKSDTLISILSIPTNSSAELWDNSSAELCDNISAVLRGNSSAKLWGNSRAELRGNSSAELWDNSSAVLWDNSSAVLRENSNAKYCDEVLIKFMDIYPIGSRQDHLKIYITDKSTIIRTGCFCGDPDTFEEAVKKTHKDNRHYIEYMVALDMIRVIRKQALDNINNPTGDGR